MTDDGLAESIRRNIVRGQNTDSFLGRIVNIDTVNASVTVAPIEGVLIRGIRCLASYTPVVNDLVVMLRVRGQWTCLGKLPINLGTAPTITTAAITPAAYHRWIYRDDPPLLTPVWVTNAVPPVAQGKAVELKGNPTFAAIAMFSPSVASQIPTGVTITSCKVRMTRSPQGTLPDFWSPTRGDDSPPNGLSYVGPVLYGHNYTAKPADGTTPAAVPGYGPWKPGTLTPGQSATWDLPSTWLTALLAGTILGLGIYSTQAADYALFASGSLALELTYI